MYKISLGQLITMWVFGLIVIFFLYANAITSDGGGGFQGVLLLVIFFFLVFYSIGWKNKRKEIKNNHGNLSI